MKSPFGKSWWGGRLALAVAVAVVVPACGGSDGDQGIQGTPGTQGPSGANAVEAWSAPVNISNQVAVDDSDAYGQQSVTTSDGRLHVVYFAYNTLEGNDQLWYTSSVSPFSTWDTPVLIPTLPGYPPQEFDLAAASDNSVHVAFTANSGGAEMAVLYSQNTAAARLTFSAPIEAYEELFSTNTIFNPQIVMRGTTAHIVFSHEDGNVTYSSNDLVFTHVHNNADPDLFVATELDRVEWSNFSSDYFVLLNDGASNTHLVYGYNEGNNNEERVAYRGIPSAAGNGGAFGARQNVSGDDSTSDIWLSQEAPIVKLDGSSNLYVFWKQWEPNVGYPVLFCNIKSGSFDQARATLATDEPNQDNFWQDFSEIGDVLVASDGRIHLIWRTNNSYGTEGMYPVWYRTKAPGTNASTGWEVAEVAGWARNSPGSFWTTAGGARQGGMVRSTSDGDVHAFWQDQGFEVEVFHSYKSGGTWRSGGSPSRPTTVVTTLDGLADTWLIDVGFEGDGTPYALWSAKTDFNSSQNSDIAYSHRWEGEWLVGTDVNGVNHADPRGDFWVGSASGKLHLIWQQEVDPFDYSGTYDLVFSTQE